jgi:hypothetical protein
MSDYLTMTAEDDGKLFRIRVLRTGEERIARFHHLTLAGRELRFPCFADPDHPEDYLRWVHDGNARAVSRADQVEGAVSEAVPKHASNQV